MSINIPKLASIALIGVALVGVAVIVSTSGTEAPTIAETIKVSKSAVLGDYLVDERGMTLYYFPKDTINTSNCFGQCQTAWPLFSTEEVIVKQPLLREDFGSITRGDGSRMTTYKGWPLYYYFKDEKPGDTLGEGVGNVWYVLTQPFYTVMVQNKELLGNYLVDPNGMTFYYFTRDTQGTATALPKSSCAGQCLESWPLVSINNVIAPSLLKKSDFSAIVRSDGASQLVYKGWPLYYYAQDKDPGDTKGEGVNGVWFAVKP